jgi:hypothetical protein
VKSIKTRRKPSSEIPRRFGLTILDLAKEKEKNSGITPAMPSGSSKIHDGCFTESEPLTWELLNSTPLRCQLEWRPVWLFFATSTPLLQRGMTR